MELIRGESIAEVFDKKRINPMLRPIIFNSNTIELTVHTSCYLGLGLTLCYMHRGRL